MKKIIIMFMLAASVATMATSCKKEKQSEKERVQQLLVSGKWYYQSTSSGQDCFTENNYWEFKADGSVTETWDFGNGTYTLSGDGKTIIISNGIQLAVTSISQSTFEFNLTGDGNVGITLGKTAKNCDK